MPRSARALSALVATAAAIGTSAGTVTAAAVTSTPEAPAQVVVSTTTTSDINVPLVSAGEDATQPLVNRAVAGPVRLAGATRYETAVQISRRAYTASTTKTVYLVGGTRLDEALAGGALTDGPVLLVPTTGVVPEAVLAEIRRLSPRSVTALGGTASVSGATLSAAAQGIPTSRLGSNDVYETAVAIARRAFPSGAATVYLARVGGTADAVSGSSLSNGPVIPVPGSGTVPASVRSFVAGAAPSKVVGLGGPGAISDAVLTSTASGRPTSRLAGADRFATSQRVAEAAFPQGSRVAYLAGSSVFADAVAGGMLGDGPILLTPPPTAKAQVDSTAATMTRLGVTNVGTLGGINAVANTAVTSVVAKVPTATTGSLPTYLTPAPAPSPTPTPTPTPTYTPPAPAPYVPPAPVEETCESVIASFRPVPMDSRYTIRCASGFDTSDTLGVTSTWLTTADEFVHGTVEIRSDLRGDLLRAVIAHELSHAWSYARMTPASRQRFATYVGESSWDSGSYDAMPAEVWARTQATCVGWPDGFRRKQLTCAELKPFGWPS